MYLNWDDCTTWRCETAEVQSFPYFQFVVLSEVKKPFGCMPANLSLKCRVQTALIISTRSGAAVNAISHLQVVQQYTKQIQIPTKYYLIKLW